jgi:xanthine dehydrogenase accessory factor
LSVGPVQGDSNFVLDGLAGVRAGAGYPGAVSEQGLRELGAALRSWAADGVGVVRVLDRHGFGTVESGQLLAGTASGSVAGLLYRGALDAAARPLVAAAATAPRTRDAHVAEPDALAAGLACAAGPPCSATPCPRPRPRRWARPWRPVPRPRWSRRPTAPPRSS